MKAKARKFYTTRPTYMHIKKNGNPIWPPPIGITVFSERTPSKTSIYEGIKELDTIVQPNQKKIADRLEKALQEA